MTQRRQARVRVDADEAWKRVLSELLAEFVAFALPDLHAAVDWGREPIFLEQELRPILRQAAMGRRVADLVVQVWLRDGQATWLLIHIEVQGRSEGDFAERMYTYAALLQLRYRARSARRQPPQPLLSPPVGLVGIAVLTDTVLTWQPGDYRWGWGEYGVTYRYRALKLAEWRARFVSQDDDTRPFAWVVRTWLAVQDAGRALPAQALVRREIGQQLLAARRAGLLDTAQVSAIFTVLGAVGGLPDDLAARIDAELGRTEEGSAMPEVLNLYERRAIVRGQLELVLLLLVERTGPLDDALEAQIGALDQKALLTLAKALLHFSSRADLDQWLAEHPAPQR